MALDLADLASVHRSAAAVRSRWDALDLLVNALWKKRTTLPSLAYAGIPYQVRGATWLRPGGQ